MHPWIYHRVYRPLAPHVANFTANAYAFWALSNGTASQIDAIGTFVVGTELTSLYGAEEALPRPRPGENRLERIMNVGTWDVLSAGLGALTGSLLGVAARHAR